MEKTINLTAELKHKCNTCSTILVKVESRHNTDYWYCASCDLYYEISHAGHYLRNFKQKVNVVISNGEPS